jgi:UDP-N-acetyl-D-mannosaminuronic acid transferase (WecB/TagA/CpsF family)
MYANLHGQGRYDGYSDAEASKKKLLKDVFKKVITVAVDVVVVAVVCDVKVVAEFNFRVLHLYRHDDCLRVLFLCSTCTAL